MHAQLAAPPAVAPSPPQLAECTPSASVMGPMEVCGSFGCTLRNLHAGLCAIQAPQGKRQRRSKEEAASAHALSLMVSASRADTGPGDSPEIGDDVMCASADGLPHRCHVVERRLAPAAAACVRGAGGSVDGAGVGAGGGGDVGRWQYYLHFHGTNRRLDEWVGAERLLSGPLDPLTIGNGGWPGGAASSVAASGGRTRNLKRRSDALNNVSLSEAGLDPALEREHEQTTKVKNIHRIIMGPFEIETWYFSPYPDAFGLQPLLYICEFSLKYIKKHRVYERHLRDNTKFCPPGVEIYRTPAPTSSQLANMEPPTHLTVWELDGCEAKVYCQCLCLLAKLFLDHKTLYFDTDPFLFYVLCECDSGGRQRIVGYFSKEKSSSDGNNLACILVLPPHQRKGYGKFLISLAYELSRRDGKPGAPEKPLSDLGQVTFRSYWSRVILDTLHAHGGKLSVKQLVALTAVRTEDVLETLQALNLLRYVKGQHVVAANPRAVEEHLRAHPKRQLAVDPALLSWGPPPPMAALTPSSVAWPPTPSHRGGGSGRAGNGGVARRAPAAEAGAAEPAVERRAVAA
mmetsp:Transcript_16202/g.41285  ORF Transcript_16202/g.41285 Transcript_16202/m.41285 type:complete len:572 (-) Transcript_16202:225-1940(-)